jgi:hypothetical protein
VAPIRTDTEPLTKRNDPEYLGIKEIELWRIGIEPNAPSRPLVAATARECLGSHVFGKFPQTTGGLGKLPKNPFHGKSISTRGELFVRGADSARSDCSESSMSALAISHQSIFIPEDKRVSQEIRGT